MKLGLKRSIKLGLFALTIFFLISFIPILAVEGINEIDSMKVINPGYANAYVRSISNFKNQRFTLLVEYDTTVPTSPIYDFYILAFRKDSWDLVVNNPNVTINDITTENYLIKGLVSGIDRKETFITVIPDWDDWSFVYFNPNNIPMSVLVKIDRQHILWWLWIVIPLITILGLVGYYVADKTTRYERARMHPEKAFKKLSAGNEGERKRAIYWLQSNGTKEELEKLKQILEIENPLIRANAAIAIGGISKRLQDSSATQQLINLYKKDERSEVKEQIVSALCDFADESSLEILEKYLLIDKNEILRFRIAESLKRIASPKSAPSLVKIINGSNTDTLKIASKQALEEIAKKQETTFEDLIKKHS